ncbi:hypothetical protein IAI18_04150 [Acetobacteraceae bacterium H6797]|nr:hypothetical protein [Acetobacteraceae bacterium H6797]
MNAITKPKVETLAEEIEALRAKLEAAISERGSHSLSEAVNRARAAAADMAASTRDMASTVASTTRDAATTVASSTREIAGTAAAVAQREAQAAAGQVRAHPFLSVAIAASIGCLAGLLMGASARRD